MALPQDTQRVGVVVGDPALVAVQAQAEPGGQGGGVGMGRPTVAAAVGVQRPLAVALAARSVSLREQDLAHAYCEEAEGGRVLAFLCSTVMAAVRVTSEGGIYNNNLHNGRIFNDPILCKLHTMIVPSCFKFHLTDLKKIWIFQCGLTMAENRCKAIFLPQTFGASIISSLNNAN